jgi:eukaryotic translation initiation factor 2C
MVYLDELPQIKDGCQVAMVPLNYPNPNWLPGITLLIVGKRHHMRFFPIKDPHWIAPPPTYKDSKMIPPVDPATKNLKAGLVIDHSVVDSNRFSFYLQSHDSPLGTAHTGHYVVLENSSGYTPQELQELVSVH